MRQREHHGHHDSCEELPVRGQKPEGSAGKAQISFWGWRKAEAKFVGGFCPVLFMKVCVMLTLGPYCEVLRLCTPSLEHSTYLKLSDTLLSLSTRHWTPWVLPFVIPSPNMGWKHRQLSMSVRSRSALGLDGLLMKSSGKLPRTIAFFFFFDTRLEWINLEFFSNRSDTLRSFSLLNPNLRIPGDLWNLECKYAAYVGKKGNIAKFLCGWRSVSHTLLYHPAFILDLRD